MSNTRTAKAAPEATPEAQQPQMTPHQALGILDQATMRLESNRQDHMTIITALNTLAAVVGPAPQ